MELQAKFKNSFDEIIGDPFAKPEPIQGHYSLLRSGSGVKVADNDFTAGVGSPNAARPNIVDFFVDVESAIADGLKKYSSTYDHTKLFLNTYLWEDSKRATFSQAERAVLEQIIGRILVARSISPVGFYFTAIRHGGV